MVISGLGSEAIGGGLGVWGTAATPTCKHKWVQVGETTGEVAGRWGATIEPTYRKSFCTSCGSILHSTLDTRMGGCWHGRVVPPDEESRVNKLGAAQQLAADEAAGEMLVDTSDPQT